MPTRASKILFHGYILVFVNIGETQSSLSPILYFIPQLPDLEALMKKENQKILTPLVSLDTPGKATVEVVILADPVSALQIQYAVIK